MTRCSGDWREPGMTPPVRIGLLVFAAFGGLFFLATAGVVGLIVWKGPAAESKHQAVGALADRNPAAGAMYEDGVTRDKESFNRGDRVAVVGRVQAVTP